MPAPPGLPEGIATDAQGNVFVGTNPGDFGPQGPNFGQPTKIFEFAPDGRMLRDFTVDGQSIASALPAYGTQGAAFDGDGFFYTGDKVPARIIRLDPRTGEQRDYVRLPDVPTCAAATDKQQCSDTVEDLRPSANYLAFAPDGTLYVSDLQQAIVYRIPPGGGSARVALTDRRLDSTNGPNGLQFLADGRTFVLGQTLSEPQGGSAGMGMLFTGTIGDDGRSGPLRLLHTFAPGEGVDGLTIARSGNVYVNLFTVNQIAVIAPDGREVSRFPSPAAAATQSPVPFDNPASSVFVGQRLLITNQSVTTQNPETFAVLDAFVGEDGLPLFRPSIRAITAAAGGSAGGGSSSADGSGQTGRRAVTLRVSVSPRRDVRAPRRFTTSGTVVLPAGVAAASACNGRVAVQVMAGDATISTRRVAVSRSCRFGSTVTFGASRRFTRNRRLRFVVRFGGNRLLLPRRAASISREVR